MKNYRFYVVGTPWALRGIFFCLSSAEHCLTETIVAAAATEVTALWPTLILASPPIPRVLGGTGDG